MVLRSVGVFSVAKVMGALYAVIGFLAGLIFAMLCDDYRDLEQALDFAVAASCLAHSIKGDLNYSTRAEVDALAAGSASGRVVR